MATKTGTFTYEQIDQALEKTGLRLKISAERRGGGYEYFITTDYRVSCRANASFLKETGHSTIGATSNRSFDHALEKLVKNFSKEDVVINDTRKDTQWEYAYRFDPEKGEFIERELKPSEKEKDCY